MESSKEGESVGAGIIMTESGELPPEYYVVDENIEEPEEASGGGESIQELVNTALESKLQGFQAQMQQMLSMIQTVSGSAVPSDAKPAPPNPAKPETTESGDTVGENGEGEVDASRKTGDSSSAPQGEAQEGEDGETQKTKSGEAGENSGTGKGEQITGAQRRKNHREEMKQLQIEMVKKLKSEQEEFEQFCSTIASALNLPIPPEETGPDKTNGDEGEAGEGTIEGHQENKENGAVMETGEGATAVKVEEPEATVDTGETTDRMEESSQKDAGANSAEEVTTTPGAETTVNQFPAEEVVKQSWDKFETQTLSTLPYETMERIVYQWPAKDHQAYGRVPGVNEDIMLHLNDQNQKLGRKSMNGLPMDQGRINKDLKQVDAMFRFQQKIHSYSSYFLIALGQHIRGESNFDEETVSKLLFYLGKGLADACDISVQGSMMATKARRRLYIDAMNLPNTGNARYTTVNKPFAEELFPSNVREMYSRHHIDLFTPTRKRKHDNSTGEGSVSDGRRQSGTNESEIPRRGGRGRGSQQQRGAKRGRMQQDRQQKSPMMQRSPVSRNLPQSNVGSNRNQGNSMRGNKGNRGNQSNRGNQGNRRNSYQGGSFNDGSGGTQGQFQAPGSSKNARNKKRKQQRQPAFQSYSDVGSYSSRQQDDYSMGRDRPYSSMLSNNIPLGGGMNGGSLLERTGLGSSSASSYDSFDNNQSNYIQPTSLYGYTSFSQVPSQTNYPSNSGSRYY